MNNKAIALMTAIGNEARITSDLAREINAMDYLSFLQSKTPTISDSGIEPHDTHPRLFDWQSQIVKWALRRGRAAIFADCGMGKTLMQIEWARQIGKRVLIVAPLSVAEQTIEEASSVDDTIRFCSSPQDQDGIWITNYQKLHHFIGARYDAIVLDESSILKSLDGKTRTMLIQEFSSIPHRLCCTATPAPNDLSELANHSEFLGAMTRVEMLATFFVHDSERSGSDGWRLKGHAKEAFWQWMAQWAIFIRRPSDLGYPDDKFQLPGLTINCDVVEVDVRQEGCLFPGLTGGIKGRSEMRRLTIEDRVNRAVEIINASNEQWLIWCKLNDEGRLIHKALDGDSVLIEGATDDDDKVEFERQWRSGKVKTLVSKPSMFGFGLNWQHCRNVMYLGMDDSFEQYYQSVRRCWRFGQKRDVNVVIITSDAETAIVENINRKEQQAMDMAESIVSAIRSIQIEMVIQDVQRKDVYKMKEIVDGQWKMMMGDCVERIREIPDRTIGLSVFSPPFASLYTYSSSDRDMGNSKDYDQFFEHFKFLIPELLRVTKPGRRACVHVQQLTTTKVTHGVIGWRDFRADVVRHFVESGWVYDGEVVIDKDPQAQAIRTKAKALMFVQKNKDSAWSRPAMADYILLFRAPGDNLEPIQTDVTNEEWIQFARPIWYGIDESDTLNYAVARESSDERHICPLQLGTIERCVRLWSNQKDTVLSPFAGIGSEGYVSVKHGRKFIGIELKESYFNQAVKNLKSVSVQESLFALQSE